MNCSRRLKSDLDQQQREFLLHQQMKTIQNELGGNPIEKEIEEYKKKAETKKWNDEVKKVFTKGLTSFIVSILLLLSILSR